MQLTLSLSEIKNFLKVDIAEDDALIAVLKDGAIREASDFLNTDFHTYDDEGNLIQTNEAPPAVKVWVMSRIAQVYDHRAAPPAPDFSGIGTLRVHPFKG